MPRPEGTFPKYVLGNSDHEQQRLKLQASIVGTWTENYLLAAGLEKGMNVLDLGSGMGDVTLLAAEIVGPSGSVTGIDRDPVVLQKAKERVQAQGHSAPVTFLHSEILNFRPKSQFDAIIGRYVLLYQPDPSRVLSHAAAFLRRGGILCFHELSFGTPASSYPATSLFGDTVKLIGEVIRRSGINPDFGLFLAKTFADAGFSRPTIKADVPVGGEAGSYIYGWATETVKTLLPVIETLGLGTAHDLQIETLAQRMEEEAVVNHSELVGPLQVGAWLRT
ncbi:class I SAM-dependent methyltransferase [Acidisarcina polymorpha]|uniref:class I SAM-dependent methyltransferase n=1 Tax=Acidisarcina polymorpha TaxID=2211140 RepID=UPI000DEF7938|nr:class I SAM-dependent methyltransferase [Acidisarcina polymorpha]